MNIAFYEEHVKREFKIKYDPRDLSKIALYSTDERFIAIAKTKNKLAEAVQDYRPDERKHIDEVLEVKKKQKASALRKLNIASEVSDAETILGLGHRYVSKEVLNQAEADMYTNYHEQKESKDEEQYIDLEAERRARVRRQ